MKRVMVFSMICTLGAIVTLPALALTGPNLLSAGDVTINAADKKGVVVVFMSARCPCSAAHVNTLKTLRADFADFAFVGVHANGDESTADARAHFASLALPFPVIDDHARRLADRFGASRTPHAFVLDHDERVIYRGGVSDSHDPKRARHFPLREALDDARAGRPVRRAEARALGCAISRSDDATH